MYHANPGKKLDIKVGRQTFRRFPVKTHVIVPGEKMFDIISKYALPFMKERDILVIAEKALAISQGRAYSVDKIKPSRLAKLLTRFIYKPSYGIGISIPVTMELAIREAGRPRILLAAAAAAVTKPFGIKGIFYKIAGPSVKAIDGPADYVIPPYNRYASLGPKNPQKVALQISKKIKHPVVILDACDLGAWVLGSEGVDAELICQIFKDNPLGQTNQKTPLCIVRQI